MRWIFHIGVGRGVCVGGGGELPPLLIIEEGGGGGVT